MLWKLFVSLSLCAASLEVGASDSVVGDTHTFLSPNGVTEACVALAKMPGGVYSSDDIAREQALCAIDIYDSNVGICPKLRSTSPGTFIYSLEGGDLAGKQAAFENKVCPRGDTVVPEADGPPASFKVTMNDPQTSGTFSTASLLYYHFSRYLDTYAFVPVAVYRSIDRTTHEQRVTARGLAWSANKKALRMNNAAWRVLDEVEKKPEKYPATDELFTADRRNIYGVLLHVNGKRYGAEINGTRESGWGEGQNRDFQQTAPFLALKSEKPLREAMAAGLETARRDPGLKKANRGVSDEQLVYWMQELTEITLLDYIFSQQDRIGNIDYVPYWHWVDDGEVHVSEDTAAPAAAEGLAPQRLHRTWLNDNDAGGKHQYVNYTKRTGMLETIRHYNPRTYRLLMDLDRDFAARGELFSHLQETFGLTSAQANRIATATREAAAIMRASCNAGKLLFDLDPDRFLLEGSVTPKAMECGN